MSQCPGSVMCSDVSAEQPLRISENVSPMLPAGVTINFKGEREHAIKETQPSSPEGQHDHHRLILACQVQQKKLGKKHSGPGLVLDRAHCAPGSTVMVRLRSPASGSHTLGGTGWYSCVPMNSLNSVSAAGWIRICRIG